jgi:hypothetical protein
MSIKIYKEAGADSLETTSKIFPKCFFEACDLFYRSDRLSIL